MKAYITGNMGVPLFLRYVDAFRNVMTYTKVREWPNGGQVAQTRARHGNGKYCPHFIDHKRYSNPLT